MNTENLLYLMNLEEKMDKMAETLKNQEGENRSIAKILKEMKEKQGNYGETREGHLSMIYQNYSNDPYNHSTNYEYKGSFTISGEGIIDTIIIMKSGKENLSISIKTEGKNIYTNERGLNFSSNEPICCEKPLKLKFKNSITFEASSKYDGSINIYYRLKE